MLNSYFLEEIPCLLAACLIFQYGANMPNLMTNIHWAEVPNDWATNLCTTSTAALRAFLHEPHGTKENYSPYNQSTDMSKYMGVSKNRGTPKWMVKIMENPIKMDDFGVPLFLETPMSMII